MFAFVDMLFIDNNNKSSFCHFNTVVPHILQKTLKYLCYRELFASFPPQVSFYIGIYISRR